jgi:hypothetical protein
MDLSDNSAQLQKSKSLWSCPNCRREMWHYSPSHKKGEKSEAERFLCVFCSSEFVSIDRDGVRMLNPVTT